MGLVRKNVRELCLHAVHDTTRASPYSTGGTKSVLLETLCDTLGAHDPVADRKPVHAVPRVPRVGRVAEPNGCVLSADDGCYNRILVRALIQVSGEEVFCAGMAGTLDV